MNNPQVPEEYRPMSPWAYFGYEILYAVPLIGWIFLIIHAIGAANLNKRNFARSYFVIYILVIIVIIVCALLDVSLPLKGAGVSA